MTAASDTKPGDEKPHVLIRRITLQNLLSFGPEGVELELGPLNVPIGPNGSGKSRHPCEGGVGISRTSPR